MNKELIEILKYLGQIKIGDDGSGCFACRMIDAGVEWCDVVTCDNCPLNLRRNESYYSHLIFTIPVGSS